MAIGAWIASEAGGKVERWELCAFNNLCRDKYRRLGMEWAYGSTILQTRAELDEIGSWAKSSGFDPGRIFVTGAARVEEAVIKV